MIPNRNQRAVLMQNGAASALAIVAIALPIPGADAILAVMLAIIASHGGWRYARADITNERSA